MEDNLSPAPSFQNELNFTKCTQAVCAVKDMLSAVCKKQWDRLQGKGVDGLNFQEMEEGLCPPGPSAHGCCAGHPNVFLPPVAGRCPRAQGLLEALAPLSGPVAQSLPVLTPPP